YREQDLLKIFSACGEVVEVSLPRKYKGGPLRGFACIQYRKREEAEKAINELNETKHHGRTIAVDWSLPKDKYLEAMGAFQAKLAGDPGNGPDRAHEDQIKDEDIRSFDEEETEDESENGSVLDEDHVMADIDSEDDKSAEETEEKDDDDEIMTDAKDDDNSENHRSTGTIKRETHPPSEGNVLFIRNLAFEATEEELGAIFKIFRPIVQREFGFTFDVNIIGRGYYPQGGGEVMLRVDPVVGRALNPIKMVDRGTIVNIKGQTSKHYEYARSGISDPTLPEISGIKPDIEINVEKAVSKGFDLLLWAETSTGCIMSGSAVGSKRQSPEDVGKRATEELLQNLRHGGCVDEYLQDQLIIFMSLAEGKSQLVTGPITLHTRTAIHFAEKMLGIKFQISKLESQQYVKLEDDAPDEAYDGGPFIIECEGVGLKIVNDNAQQTA
ncbi:13667_t:CDS:2, partial [Acaulospora morrowiae]